MDANILEMKWEIVGQLRQSPYHLVCGFRRRIGPDGSLHHIHEDSGRCGRYHECTQAKEGRLGQRSTGCLLGCEQVGLHWRKESATWRTARQRRARAGGQSQSQSPQVLTRETGPPPHGQHSAPLIGVRGWRTSRRSAGPGKSHQNWLRLSLSGMGSGKCVWDRQSREVGGSGVRP